MASTHRINRLRELLLREFSDIVAQLKDPRVRMVTVVDAEVSKDLRYATMFVSILGTESEQQAATAALENALGFIRREVAQRVKLRYVPELRVAYDPTVERAARLTALINSLGKRDGEA
jgi:ribosome-binding factor A